MIVNYIFNFVMFFAILNFNWLIKQEYKATTQRELLKRVGVPFVLGALLSAIDAMKIAFFYQIFLFIVLVAFAYFYYRLRWRKR